MGAGHSAAMLREGSPPPWEIELTEDLIEKEEIIWPVNREITGVVCILTLEVLSCLMRKYPARKVMDSSASSREKHKATHDHPTSLVSLFRKKNK